VEVEPRTHAFQCTLVCFGMPSADVLQSGLHDMYTSVNIQSDAATVMVELGEQDGVIRGVQEETVVQVIQFFAEVGLSLRPFRQLGGGPLCCIQVIGASDIRATIVMEGVLMLSCVVFLTLLIGVALGKMFIVCGRMDASMP